MSTATTLFDVKESGQDYEWYPTTPEIIDAVKRRLPKDARSIMDIGAGDGRVLAALAEKCGSATLYGIEKSTVLVQAQPDNIIPVGTEFHEQNLACLPVDYIFCNPPYSAFESWSARIIESGFARLAFLVIPQRWEGSAEIKSALAKRGATAKTVHAGDFLEADRSSRAVVHVVEVRYPLDERYYGGHEKPTDPFDIWFEQNISTFDESEAPAEDPTASELARQYAHATISDMVASYSEEYGRLESNYRAIFKLDGAILKELGVTKDHVREGIKKKMQGLKGKYWQILFDRLDAITSRLSTKTKSQMLEKLGGNSSVAFTATNAYAVVLWAIKNANRYFSQQLVDLFKELTTFEGAMNYKSNLKTWTQDRWRFRNEEHSHYALDYRIVVHRYNAIKTSEYAWEHTGGLHRTCHELIADIGAVMSNLGFAARSGGSRSTDRQWRGGEWQDFCNDAGEIVFQVKAYMNGNLHMRFMPEAIKALNVEAGRLMGWLRSKRDVVAELGYTEAEADRYYGSSMHIAPSQVRLLTA